MYKISVKMCCWLLVSAQVLYAAEIELESKDQLKQPLLLQESQKPMVVPESKQLKLYEYYKQSNKRDFTPVAWCFLQSYPAQTKQELSFALEQLNKDAVGFYAPYAGDLAPILANSVRAGNVKQIEVLLPALRLATVSGEIDERRELTWDDVSGLASTAECKDEATGLQMAKAIVNFYKPTREECDTICCVPCPAQCQQRRKAFIIYGASKALEKAITCGKSLNYINYLLNDCDAYISREALTAVKERKEVEPVINAKYQQQHAASNAALLSLFGCLHKKMGDKDAYGENLGYSIMRNVKPRPRSWLHPRQLCPQ